MVMWLSDAAKPGELASFHYCQKGILLSSNGVHLLSRIYSFILCSVYEMWRSLYACLCFCCQSPALASVEEDGYSECSVELELRFEADVSAFPDGVKS